MALESNINRHNINSNNINNRGNSVKDHFSQQGSADNVENKTNDKKEVKGHMALRNNVWETRELLWDILKPSELRVVDAIISKTIKWRVDEAKVSINDLSDSTKIEHSNIYRILKSLENKGIILRRKHDHDLVLGLNPKYFGGLLIKKHEEAVQNRKNRVKMVVDNSKSVCRIDSDLVLNRQRFSVDSTPNKDRINTKTEGQNTEIIEENRSLKTLLKDINLKTLLKDSENGVEKGVGESFTPFGGKGSKTKPKIQCDDPIEERNRQLRMLEELESRNRQSG